jgi:hypothetical protein
MGKADFDMETDVVIVGSGTCGGTIASSLAGNSRRVTILEKGSTVELRETFLGTASIAAESPVGEDSKALRAIATGGSTALYFGVAEMPPLHAFRDLGIDLAPQLTETLRELPVARLDDALLSAQTRRLQESSAAMGYPMRKNLMLIDQAKCQGGYSYQAKWKAKAAVEAALRRGATLVDRAEATRVLVESGRACGVEYVRRKPFGGRRICRIKAEKVVLSAGSLVTAGILRNSGLAEVGTGGFYCDPAFALFGTVEGLSGTDNFVGCISTEDHDDVSYGDANMTGTLYRIMALANGKPHRILSFPRTIGIGVKLKDACGGRMTEAGKFRKELSQSEKLKLKQGEEIAARILRKAGARNIFRGKTVAASPANVVRIGEHLDGNLETRIKGLHVCDASVLNEKMRVPPTLTLVCLAKHLARRLHASL